MYQLTPLYKPNLPPLNSSGRAKAKTGLLVYKETSKPSKSSSPTFTFLRISLSVPKNTFAIKPVSEGTLDRTPWTTALKNHQILLFKYQYNECMYLIEFNYRVLTTYAILITSTKSSSLFPLDFSASKKYVFLSLYWIVCVGSYGSLWVIFTLTRVCLRKKVSNTKHT